MKSNPVADAYVLMVESNELAKKAAKSAAEGHKNLKVTSHGNEHFIHQKGDNDGVNGYVSIKHEGGKFHVSHESGVTDGGHKTFDKHEDAAAHAKSLL